MYMLPAIDILGGRAVRLAKGDYDAVTVYNQSAVAQAAEFEGTGSTWIHMVDLDGARSGKPENIDTIRAIVAKTSLKVEVGGGIRTMETVDALVEAGVSRVVLGTALVKDPEFARAAIEKYPDIMAAGIDARDGEVAISGWEQGAGIPAEDLARQMADLGYKHLVYTDIARDGMQTGMDPAMYERMANVFGHPVIASGGFASLQDVEQLGTVAASIEGIITGRALYEGAIDLSEANALCAELTAKAGL